MSDLKTMTIMFAKTDQEFQKAKSSNDWVIKIEGRQITFHFNEDESFWFVSNERKTV